MEKINIQGLQNIDDIFYRYKMRKMNVIRQRTKTVIDNFDLICQDIERDPKLLLEYFKKKFNIAILHKEGVLSMTADLKYLDIEEALREFIEYFILCQKCRLPETEIININHMITLKCRCCSTKTVIDKKTSFPNKSINKFISSLLK
jgi:translation initiation factor 5